MIDQKPRAGEIIAPMALPLVGTNAEIVIGGKSDR